MYCSVCGQELPNGVTICVYCGAPIQGQNYSDPSESGKAFCPTCKEFVTPKPAPMFRAKDIVIAILLLIPGIIPALLYLGFQYYSKKDLPRECVCPICRKTLHGVTTEAAQPNQVIDVVKGVAMNKDVQQAVIQGAKGIKRAGSDFVDSLGMGPY